MNFFAFILFFQFTLMLLITSFRLFDAYYFMATLFDLACFARPLSSFKFFDNFYQVANLLIVIWALKVIGLQGQELWLSGNKIESFD